MRTFSARRTVDAKPAELWPPIADLTRHSEWSADSLEIAEVAPGRFSSRVEAKGRTFHAQIEVLISQPEELFEFRVRDSTGTYLHRIGLAEVEDGTLVTRQVTPERLSFGQHVMGAAALVPIRLPALRTSLDRLADLVTARS